MNDEGERMIHQRRHKRQVSPTHFGLPSHKPFHILDLIVWEYETTSRRTMMRKLVLIGSMMPYLAVAFFVARPLKQHLHGSSPSFAVHLEEDRGWSATTNNNNVSTTRTKNATTSTTIPYDWYSQWYPIQVEECMDKRIPHKAQLLGLDLVIWYNPDDAQWSVFADACPHRLGPLSEGRIECMNDNNKTVLLCSYHGWKFNGTGQCVDLPYSKPQLKAKHEASGKATCRVYPCRVEQGLVYVFPQSGPNASLQAALTPISGLGPPHTCNSSLWRVKCPAGLRDFPCAWDTLVENTLDPAHFCAAHHGTLGNRNTDPRYYAQRQVKNNNNDTTIHVEGDFGALTYEAPGLVRYTPDNPSMPFGGTMSISTYCVPLKPGWVRIFALVWLQKRPRWNRGAVLSEYALEVFMNPRTPVWLGHVLSSIVLHQDAALLVGQEHNLLLLQSTKKYTDGTFMANEADLAVTLFRQWVARRPRLEYAGLQRQQQPQVVDIYDMKQHHVAHCHYCQGASRNLLRLHRLARWMSWTSLWMIPMVVAAAAAASGTNPTILPKFLHGILLKCNPCLLAWTAGGSWIMGQGLQAVHRLFDRYQVQHTDNSLLDVVWKWRHRRQGRRKQS